RAARSGRDALAHGLFADAGPCIQPRRAGLALRAAAGTRHLPTPAGSSARRALAAAGASATRWRSCTGKRTLALLSRSHSAGGRTVSSEAARPAEPMESALRLTPTAANKAFAVYAV